MPDNKNPKATSISGGGSGTVKPPGGLGIIRLAVGVHGPGEAAVVMAVSLQLVAIGQDNSENRPPRLKSHQKQAVQTSTQPSKLAQKLTQ